MITKETDFIKSKLSTLGRADKLALITNSPLNDRETDLIIKRFINGMSLKECSEEYGMEINSISKKQHRIINKLYQYLIDI